MPAVSLRSAPWCLSRVRPVVPSRPEYVQTRESGTMGRSPRCLRGDLLGELGEPYGFRVRGGEGQGGRDRAAQPVGDLGQLVLAGHPAGRQFADPARGVPVGQDGGCDLLGERRAPLRYRVQFLRGQGVDAAQVRGGRPGRGQALVIVMVENLAGERGQPAQQLGQDVKLALLPLSDRRVGAERGGDGP